MSRKLRGFALLLSAAVAGAFLPGAVAGAAGATGAGRAPAQPGLANETANVPAVAWTPCAPDPKLYDCATYKVPMDYRNPSAGTVDLAMMRRRANDGARRIGSLFMNPGGPGGSGLTYPTVASRIFTPEVLDRFDIVGFDPRGVAASSPLRCFKTNEEANEVFGRFTPVPVTKPEIDGTMKASKDYTDACARNAGALVRHMSTLNVSRDLDVMRRAVGDKELTFVGFSYGTLIGATYANMYPSRVRALILDGNVDPQLRLHDGIEYDRQRALGGFELALTAFLDQCKTAGAAGCALAGGTVTPRQKFDAIRDKLRQGPVTLPDGSQATLSSVTSQVASAMYRVTRLQPTAKSLQALYQVIHPAAGVRAADASAASALTKVSRLPMYDVDPLAAETPYDSDDSYYGVNCLDKPYVRHAGLYPHVANAWEKQSPTFGRYQAFDAPPCATWPASAFNTERYSGPWNRKTANKILVVGNSYDPATQYKFAQRMQRQLDNAVLVSVDTIGHCALGRSKALDVVAARYLIDKASPQGGQWYAANEQPFPAA